MLSFGYMSQSESRHLGAILTFVAKHRIVLGIRCQNVVDGIVVQGNWIFELEEGRREVRSHRDEAVQGGHIHYSSNIRISLIGT